MRRRRRRLDAEDWTLNAVLRGPGTLGRCAHCPLRAFPFGAHHLCREECLTLGLVAANQHGDEQAACLCLSGLACRLKAREVGAAARDFATVLSVLDQELLPIPAAVVRSSTVRTDAWPAMKPRAARQAAQKSAPMSAMRL